MQTNNVTSSNFNAEPETLLHFFSKNINTVNQASRLSEVVSALGSQPSDPGSIPGPRLVDRECDDNALKALLREPPCRTCKKHPAGIKVQDYGCGSLDLINYYMYFREIQEDGLNFRSLVKLVIL